MTSSFNHLLAPLNAHFLSAYNKLTESSIPLINQINRHVLETPGKQLRPQMTMLTACCCGLNDVIITPDHPLFTVSAAIELLHASSLIHDDVVDNSDTRRGNPSVNSLWGNKAAVLLGDFYLAKVMQALNQVDNNEITAIINDAVIQMSEGELLQLQHSGDYSPLQDIYLSIIEKKTASFMAACCLAGTSLATHDMALREQARRFGLNIGLAFQIRDDILDYMPASVTGKPQGNDLREHKCTLPLILALQNMDSNNKDFFLSLLKDSDISDTKIKNIIDTVSQGGYLNAAAKTLELYVTKAREALNQLPDNPYRQALYELTEKTLILS